MFACETECCFEGVKFLELPIAGKTKELQMDDVTLQLWRGPWLWLELVAKGCCGSPH